MKKVIIPEDDVIDINDVISNPASYFIVFKSNDRIVRFVLKEERYWSSYIGADCESVEDFDSLLGLYTCVKKNYPNLEIYTQEI